MLADSSFQDLVSASTTQLADDAVKFKHLVEVDPAASLSNATLLHVCGELGLERGVSEETEERAVVIDVELVGGDFVLLFICLFLLDGCNVEHVESCWHGGSVVDVVADGCWISFGAGAIEILVHDSEVVKLGDSALETAAKFENIEV